jgi:hypothetical protein
MKVRHAFISLACGCVLYAHGLHAQTGTAQGAGEVQQVAAQERKDIVQEAVLKARQARVDRAGREVKQCQTALLKAEAKAETHSIERRRADLTKAQKELENAQGQLLDSSK